MINFFRKLLRIHTLKILLVNPTYIDQASVKDLQDKHYPVHVIFTQKTEDFRVIDTGIPVKMKEDTTNV